MNGAVPPVVAAFDFDGTLTRRDTLAPFLAEVAGPSSFTRNVLLELPALAAAATRPSSRDAAKARLLRRTLSRRLATEVQATGESYGERLVATGLRSEVVARMQRHRTAGHQIVIVSASLEIYLQVVASRLELDGLVCTRLEVGDDGRLTGEMLNGNCRGREKARRLRAWLHEHEIPDAQIWAYGNSSGDREMLAMAYRPIRVRRGRMEPSSDAPG